MGCLLFYTLSLSLLLSIYLSRPPEHPPSPVCCSRRFPLTRLFSLFRCPFFHLLYSVEAHRVPPLKTFLHLRWLETLVCPFSVYHTRTPDLLSPLFFFHFLLFFIWARIPFHPHSTYSLNDSKCLGPEPLRIDVRARTYTKL